MFSIATQGYPLALLCHPPSLKIPSAGAGYTTTNNERNETKKEILPFWKSESLGRTQQAACVAGSTEHRVSYNTRLNVQLNEWKCRSRAETMLSTCTFTSVKNIHWMIRLRWTRETLDNNAVYEERLRWDREDRTQEDLEYRLETCCCWGIQ